MRRRKIAGPALELYERIEKIAGDYNQRDCDNASHFLETMDQWQSVALALAIFQQDLHEPKEPPLPKNAIWLLLDLSHFIESLKKRRPTVLDCIPKSSGQRTNSGTEHALVQCCLAITSLMNAGESKEDAAKYVAKMMKKVGVPFPPRRRNSISDWKSLDNWRDKLLSREKGADLFLIYEHGRGKIDFEKAQEYTFYARLLIRELGDTWEIP